MYLQQLWYQSQQVVPTGSPTFRYTIDFNKAQVNELKASDGDQYDHFGYAVALRTDMAAVGAYGHGGTGAVYVYALNHPVGSQQPLSWDQRHKLLPSDSSDNSYYGYAVAMNNNRTIFVGAYRANEQTIVGAGAVYVYDENNRRKYVQSTKINAFVPVAHEYFGCAIACDKNWLMVGAYGNSDNGRGTNAGAVYMYYNQKGLGYSNAAKLYASDASAYDLFGSAVSISGSIAVVGAHGDDKASGTASGAAYVYRYNDKTSSWTQEAKLVGSDVNNFDYFGFSVCVYNGLIIVGAYLGDGYASNSGAVYSFEYGAHMQVMQGGRDPHAAQMNVVGWYQTGKFAPVDGKASTYFGYSVSLYDRTAIVGAYGDSLVASGAGSAYVYGQGYKGRWEIEHKMYSSASEYDAFGCAVSIYKDVVIVGADMGDGVVTDSGSAYIFTPTSEYSRPDLPGSTDAEKMSSMLGGAISTSTMETVGTAGIVVVLVAALGVAGYFYSRRQTHDMSELPMDSVHGLLGGTGIDISNTGGWSSHTDSSGKKDKEKKKKKKTKTSETA